MFAKWLEEYQRLSEKSRLVSKLSAFLISIFSFLSLYDLARFFNEYPQYLDSFIEESGLLSAIAFQISILIIFVSRFVLLFFKTKKVFWISQILWLFGLTLLASYWFVSRPSELSFGIYSTYPTIFIHASRSFDFFGMWYLLLSLIRQIIMLLISLTEEK